MSKFPLDPLTRASNAVAVWKNRDFRPISLSRKRYKIGLLLRWNTTWNLYAIYQMAISS